MRPWKRRIHCNPKSKSQLWVSMDVTSLWMAFIFMMLWTDHVTGGNKVDVAREDIRLSEVKPLQKVNPNKRRKRLCDSIAVKQHFGMAGHPFAIKSPFVRWQSQSGDASWQPTLPFAILRTRSNASQIWFISLKHSANDPASVIQFMEMAEGQLSHLTMLVRTIVGIGETYSD